MVLAGNIITQNNLLSQMGLLFVPIDIYDTGAFRRSRGRSPNRLYIFNDNMSSLDTPEERIDVEAKLSSSEKIHPNSCYCFLCHMPHQYDLHNLYKHNARRKRLHIFYTQIFRGRYLPVYEIIY
jgi:hypothetical protein